MKQKILFSLFACAILLYGCSKDESVNTTHDDPVIASYSVGNTMLIDQLALYTKNGLVADATKIQQFLDGHFSSPEVKRHFYLNRSTTDQHGIAITLNFLKQNRVSFNNELMEIVESSDTLLLIASFNQIEIPALGNGACGLLANKVPAITPGGLCPTNTCTKYRRTFPILVSGSNYYLPVLNYAVSTTDWEYINGIEVTSSCSLAAPEYPIYNTLNAEFAGSLSEHDTVLVQLARLPLVQNEK